MRINREKCAAIVIDYQEKLMPVMEGKDELVTKSAMLLKGLRVLDVPLVVTQQYTKGLGATIPEIREACGTDNYIEKLAFSCWDVPEVREQAGQQNEYVIICGIEAHICVLQTVIDVKESGKVPVLVTDCISSRKAESKKIALKRAAAEGAVLTTAESLLFELLRYAGTDTSKLIQKLVK